METLTNRIFIVTYAGQGTGKYSEGLRLSFDQNENDDEVAAKVNRDSGLRFIDLGCVGKNTVGELCFATRLDGINFGTVLRIKEVA